MVVDIGFLGAKRINAPAPSRMKPFAVNFSGDAARQHERVMELKNELSRTTSDLQSALMSLSAANLEIDRLNATVSRLEKELKEEKSKTERSQKYTRKKKSTASSDVQ